MLRGRITAAEVGNAGPDQCTVQAEGPRTANIRFQLITDHDHIHRSAALQCFFENGGMRFAEAVKPQAAVIRIAQLQGGLNHPGDASAGNAESAAGFGVNQVGIGQDQVNRLPAVDFAKKFGYDRIHGFDKRIAGLIPDNKSLKTVGGRHNLSTGVCDIFGAILRTQNSATCISQGFLFKIAGKQTTGSDHPLRFNR